MSELKVEVYRGRFEKILEQEEKQKNNINHGIRHFADSIMRKNVLFETDIDFDFRCIDEKNSDEGKGLIIGGKWKNVKMTATTL